MLLMMLKLLDDLVESGQVRLELFCCCLLLRRLLRLCDVCDVRLYV